MNRVVARMLDQQHVSSAVLGATTKLLRLHFLPPSITIRGLPISVCLVTAENSLNCCGTFTAASIRFLE